MCTSISRSGDLTKGSRLFTTSPCTRFYLSSYKRRKKKSRFKELRNEVFVRKNHNALFSGSKAARILFQKWLSRYRKKRWYIHSNGVITTRPVCCSWTIAKRFELGALGALVSKDGLLSASIAFFQGLFNSYRYIETLFKPFLYDINLFASNPVHFEEQFFFKRDDRFLSRYFKQVEIWYITL